MVERRLYRPEELELLPILLEGEKQIDGWELLYRSKIFGTVNGISLVRLTSGWEIPNSRKFEVLNGTAQANYLWNHRDEFPKEWRAFRVVVPNDEARIDKLLPIWPVFYWTDYYQEWDCHDYRPTYSFYDDSRLLRLRE